MVLCLFSYQVLGSNENILVEKKRCNLLENKEVRMSLIIHAGIVLFLFWTASSFNFSAKYANSPVTYLLAFAYLYQINLYYIRNMHRRIRHEERNYASKKKLLSDSETVRWLNHLMKMIWPICLERVASQEIMLPLIPWFLEKFKPWTAKKVKMQDLYLGRNPPVVSDIRVLNQTAEDDHLILELGISFLSAEDMSAILAVQMRKRLGFGIWTNMHVKGMHLEGKVRVGVKFMRDMPFIKRIRVCFVEVPFFQMTVKPIFSHGVDVAELPGVAGWLDKLVALALEKSLVEPNMLVIDVERLLCVSEKSEADESLLDEWNKVYGKPPVAVMKVEILEANNMKASDLNGLADPFVKGYLGPHQFKTKVQKKTLNPKWQEEFKVPIPSWESANILILSVRDKDTFRDDGLGDCIIAINELKGGQRHDIWVPLENVRTGRLHVAITVEDLSNGVKRQEENSEFSHSSSLQQDTESKAATEEITDLPLEGEIEEINFNDNTNCPVWIQRPSSESSHIWAHRKNKARRDETPRSDGGSIFLDSPKYRQDVASNYDSDDTSIEDIDVNEQKGKGHKTKKIKEKLHNIRSMFHKENVKSGGSSPEAEGKEDPQIGTIIMNTVTEPKIIATDFSESISKEFADAPPHVKYSPSPEKDSRSNFKRDVENTKKNVKVMAKNVFKQASKSAHEISKALSMKSSKSNNGDSSGRVSLSEPSDESPILGSLAKEGTDTLSSPSFQAEKQDRETIVAQATLSISERNEIPEKEKMIFPEFEKSL